jgi:predicted ATPase
VLSAVRHWILGIARHQPLLMAIDDIDLLDEPSAACFAALSQDISTHPILIATSVATDRAPHAKAAVAWLHRTSTVQHLENLTRSECSALVRAVFGNAPNAEMVADRI